MTDSPIDVPTPDGMERAFRLPAYIADDADYLGIYEAMVTRLRREASGLPMNTIQQLLIERISSFYVQIKWKEDQDSFQGVNQQKEFNAYWLSLTSEFNKLLQANDDKMREALLIEVQGIVTDSLELISDVEQRRMVRRALAGKFAEINL